MRNPPAVFLTRLSLANPVAVTLAAVLIACTGILALARMGRGVLPPITFPIVTISAPYPGASARDLERLVIEPLEDGLDDVPNTDRVSATAQDGIASVVVRLRFGTSLVDARAAVQRAVDAQIPNLPPDLVPPLVSNGDVAAAPILEVALSSSLLSADEIAFDARRIVAPAIRAAAGVGSVRVEGQAVRQLTVIPQPRALAAVGLTTLDLLHAVQKGNTILPGGTFGGGLRAASVGIDAGAVAPDAIAGLSLAGSGQRVGDVARVVARDADATLVTRVDGDPVVLLSVAPATGANMTQTIAAVGRVMARLERATPRLRMMVVRSEAEVTNAAVAGVLQTLAEGIALTVAVMLIFLREWREAAIAAIAIPLSLCLTFDVMALCGMTIDLLSLMGLSLTIGILVDDSIVIVEAIGRAAQHESSPDQAALVGRRELGGVAFAITAVDVVVFAPIAFAPGIVGAFMREFALVVVVATSASLLVSFTITPLLAARWALPAVRRRRSLRVMDYPITLRHWVAQRAIARWKSAVTRFDRAVHDLARAYAGAWLPAAWRRRKMVLVATLGVSACAGYLGSSIPSEFSPPIARSAVVVDLRFPPGTALAHTDAGVRAITDTILQDSAITHVIARAGTAFDGNAFIEAPNLAQLELVTAANLAPSDIVSRVKDLASIVPDAAVAGSGAGMGGRPSLAYNLRGDDPVALGVAAQRVRALLLLDPRATDVRTSDGGLEPRLAIHVDRARSSFLGVSSDDAAQVARLVTGGTIATKARDPDGLVDVVVRSDAAARNDLDAVRNATVRAANGMLVPLAAVATFVWERAPIAIVREDRTRVVTISANTAAGGAVGPLAAAVTRALRTPGTMPAGVELVPRGDVEQFLDTVATIGAAFLFALGCVYAILAVLYRSFTLPLVILTTVPLAAVGAFGTLALLAALHRAFPNSELFAGQSLNLYSMLGIIMLVGLVAKNGILLVEYAERGARGGAAPATAMEAAARRRLRPILMTTVAMIAGMLPLALGETAGAAYRKALGSVVVGGLTSSLLLTLVVVPVLYRATRRQTPNERVTDG